MRFFPTLLFSLGALAGIREHPAGKELPAQTFVRTISEIAASGSVWMVFK